ncbi:hypothetical protein C8R44DRAFT_748454 [Mycena epipterygia]|nr:hypothetical protein C8R44DRAFT_748454 [Mycena epipterygia]
MPFSMVLNMTLALRKTHGINPRVFLLLSRQCSNSQPIKPFARQSHSSVSRVNTAQAVQSSHQQDPEASSLMILQRNIRSQVRIKPPKSAALSIPGIVLTLPHAYYTEDSSQHAPHLHPDAPTSVPMALGTHYGHGVAMDASWPVYRRLISWGARILAHPLTTVSDPMTGFCTVRKDAAPRGPRKYHTPSARTVGTSKLGAKIIIKYVLQLLQLYQRTLGVLGHVLVGVGVADVVTVVRRAGGVGRVVGGEHVWRRFGGSGRRRRNGKGLGGRLE